MLRRPPIHPLFPPPPLFRSQSVGLTRGQHLELHRPRVQVVEALLRHEPEEVPRARRLVRLRDLPAGEVRRADVDRLPLLDRKSTRLNSSHANISYADFCLIN